MFDAIGALQCRFRAHPTVASQGGTPCRVSSQRAVDGPAGVNAGDGARRGVARIAAGDDQRCSCQIVKQSSRHVMRIFLAEKVCGMPLLK